MVTYPTSQDAFAGELALLLREGDRAAPRGRKTIERLGCAFRIENPRARLIYHPIRRWSARYAIGELMWHLAASEDVEFISYYSKTWNALANASGLVLGSAYGHTLFGCCGDGPSQWERVRSLLAADPDTRRAVFSLFDQTQLTAALHAEDVACTCTAQFILRGGRLNLTTYMRSNDAWTGFGYDIFLLSFLQELMAHQLGCDLGWYQHVVGSLHLYERHELRARALVAGQPWSAPEPMPPLARPEVIPQVLQIEQQLRLRGHENVALEPRLPSFWQTMVDVLLAYRLAEAGCQEKLLRVATRLSGTCFRTFVPQVDSNQVAIA